jgi:hypothetical protein
MLPTENHYTRAAFEGRNNSVVNSAQPDPVHSEPKNFAIP